MKLIIAIIFVITVAAILSTLDKNKRQARNDRFRNNDSLIFQEMLPKGIWFEAKRNRFRIRLYHKGVTVFLKYEKTLARAIETLKRAKDIRVEHVLNCNKEPSCATSEVISLTNLLKTQLSKPLYS